MKSKTYFDCLDCSTTKDSASAWTDSKWSEMGHSKHLEQFIKILLLLSTNTCFSYGLILCTYLAMAAPPVPKCNPLPCSNLPNLERPATTVLQ